VAGSATAPKSTSAKEAKNDQETALWLPTAIVVLVCVFFDETLALASHLFQHDSGRLIGTRSPFLNWMISTGAPYKNGSQTWSFVAATRTTGIVRAGVDVYLGRKPSLLVSEMAFYGASGEQVEINRHSPFGYDTMLSSKTSGFRSGTITCSDYGPRYQDEGSYREIACSTPKGGFLLFLRRG
jgi:hypothetical protein